MENIVNLKELNMEQVFRSLIVIEGRSGQLYADECRMALYLELAKLCPVISELYRRVYEFIVLQVTTVLDLGVRGIFLVNY